MNITKTFETATDLTSFEMSELLDIDQTSPDCMGIGLAVQTTRSAKRARLIERLVLESLRTEISQAISLSIARGSNRRRLLGFCWFS
jgi:uncharacterized protein YwlG (UPF0340 family)